MSNNIVTMAKRHSRAVAEMHRTGIRAGFISSLGSMFLRQIYVAIPSCPSGFGYVWEAEDGGVGGFIACADSIGRLYRQCLLRRGLLMALPLTRFILRPSVIKRIWQTLRYPADMGPELPPAEIISMAVSPEARGKGIGKALMQAALGEFNRRGIERVKLCVGADMDQANSFHRRCGFELALTREHHGLPMNIYTIDIGPEVGP